MASPARATAHRIPPRRRRSLGRLVRRFALALVRENVPRIVVLSTLLLFLGAIAVYLIERTGEAPLITDLGEALWYGMATMTTVGYGDFVPRTAVGRVVGVALMLGGMGVLSLFTATVASALVAQRIKEGWGLEAIRMRNHVLVCGWNERGEHVLEGLFIPPNEQEQVVLVNELPEETANGILSRFRDVDVRYVHGDPAIEAVLRQANVFGARAAIVLVDTSRGQASASDERTTLVTLTLKSVKPEIRITAEAIDDRSEAHLRRAGADDVVISGEFNGFLLSAAAQGTGISLVARELLSRSGSELRREPIPSDFVGRTFGELCQDLRSRSGFMALAIVAEKKGLSLDDLLTDDYSLVDQFIKRQLTEAGREYLRFEEKSVRVLVNPPDSYVVGENDVAIGIPERT